MGLRKINLNSRIAVLEEIKRNNPEVLRELIHTHLEDFESMTVEESSEYLHSATVQNKDLSLQELLNIGLDPNSTTQDSKMLSFAFSMEAIPCAKVLLNNGAYAGYLVKLNMSPIRNLIGNNSNKIDLELMLLMKEAGYNPKNRYENELSDWDLVRSLNTEVFDIFVEVFGEDSLPEIDLISAVTSNDYSVLFNHSSKYIMKAGFSNIGNNFKTTNILLLAIKASIMLGRKHYALELIHTSEEIRMANNKRSLLDSIKGLINLSNGDYSLTNLEQIEKFKHVNFGYIYSLDAVNFLGINYLLKPKENTEHKNEAHKLFKTVIDSYTYLHVNLDIKDKLFMFVSEILWNPTVKLDIQKLDQILSEDSTHEITQSARLLLASITSYIAGDNLHGEYYLLKAKELVNEGSKVNDISFESIFLNLVELNITNALSKNLEPTAI